jgi:hypothetical protein
MLMKFSRRCLALAIASAVAWSGQQATAAPAGSPYRSTVTSLNPINYYPFDEAYGTGSGSSVASALNLGSSGVNATYRTTFGGGFAGSTDPQGTDNGQRPIIGATIGPAKPMSQFTGALLGGNATLDGGPGGDGELDFYDANDQLPGFYPNTGDPTLNATKTAAGFNGVFEANRTGEVELGTMASGNFGDPVTGAFTIAGWFRHDDNTGAFPRSFANHGDDNTGVQITEQAAWFFFVGNGAAGDGAALQAFYPSGTPASTVGDDGGSRKGQWTYMVFSTIGNEISPGVWDTSSDARLQNMQVWERYADKTNALEKFTGGSAMGNDGNVFLGRRDNAASDTHKVQDKQDEVATWNRVLQYDEREAMYVAATTPVSYTVDGSNNITGTVVTPTVNTTTASGNWGNAGNWSVGVWPLQHGGNNTEYYAAVVDHDILATTIDGSANGTDSFRSNMYSLQVNAGKTLTLDQGTVVRQYGDATIDGTVVSNGREGVFSSTVGAKDYNFARISRVDTGNNLTIGNGATLTIANAGGNEFIAEGNLTIGTGVTLNVNNTNAGDRSAAGAQLYRLAQADYNAGSGSALQEAGALTGSFATVNLPAGLDGTGRRHSLLYENRAANGVGTVDTVKIGVARPGDTDFNGTVDFTDAFTLVSNYGFGGMDWRDGYFQGTTGTVGFTDAFELTANYGFSYATTPGAIGDQPLSIVYDQATGLLTVETTNAPGSISGINLTSAGNLFIPGVANWIGQDYSFSSNTAGQQGYTTLAAFGDTFFTGDGYVIGAILAAGLDEGVLLADLTISYSVTGFAGVQTGDLIFQPVPEPSTVALLAIGLVGLVARRRRSAC